MGATRALVTVNTWTGVTYINDAAMAERYLAMLAPSQVHVPDEVTQRMAVVEAGMRVSKCLGPHTTSPLAAAVSALRKLNAVVNVAKHVPHDVDHSCGDESSAYKADDSSSKEPPTEATQKVTRPAVATANAAGSRVTVSSGNAASQPDGLQQGAAHDLAPAAAAVIPSEPDQKATVVRKADDSWLLPTGGSLDIDVSSTCTTVKRHATTAASREEKQQKHQKHGQMPQLQGSHTPEPSTAQKAIDLAAWHCHLQSHPPPFDASTATCHDQSDWLSYCSYRMKGGASDWHEFRAWCIEHER